MDSQSAGDLEARLHGANADEVEAVRLRAEAVEASTALVREHLTDYLARNPGASYEAWIAALHPENVELDHRLRIGGNPWLVVWAEAGGAPRVKEIRWLHGVLAVLSCAWAGLCLFMYSLHTHFVKGTTQLVAMATAVSVILFLIQLATLVAAVYWVRHESWPRHVYKLNIGQLLVQTCVTIVGLTGFMFNQHGLSLHRCLWETSCVTCITCLKRMGLGQEATEWVEVRDGVFSGGPFSLVSVSVDRQTLQGQTYPTSRLTNQGEPWDGLRVQAAMPRTVSFTTVEKAIISITALLYILAMVNTCLYVCTYRVSGQRQGRWIPPWLSLKRMESSACFLCFSLIIMCIWGFALHPDALFVAPVFIGIATLTALVNQLLTTLSKRHPSGGPFNQWQKRTVTAQAVAVMVAFTYIAGLCDSVIICSAARIWPTSLRTEGLQVFMWGFLIHLLLSVGYGTSLWAHLHLMRLRAVRQAHDASSSELTARPSPAEGTRPAEQPAAPEAPSATGQRDEPECVVCMDELRDTVLVPCGHICLCNACARNIMTSRRPLCPICNGAVDDLCRVYRA